jgi:hypothetical protein
MESFRELFATVLKELNSDFKLKYANKIFARYIKKDKEPRTKKWYLWCSLSYFSCGGVLLRRQFSCAFGTYEADKKEDKLVKQIQENNHFFREKCGIEVFGLVPERTKDGKYAYRGTSIKDLKESCKMNGIKGVSKMDKCELVKVLMTC